MATKIEQRIELFINGLSGMKDAVIKAAIKAEIEYLKSIYKITTVRGVLTKYRAAAVAVGIPIETMKIAKKENEKIELNYTKKIAKQQKQLIQISDYEGAIDKAIEVCNSSESISELAAALALLTGRRGTEILKTAIFKIGKKGSMFLEFFGQLKTKGEKREGQPIPILGGGTGATAANKGLKRLRELADATQLTNKQVSEKWEREANRKALQLFKNNFGLCSMHDLRKAYATIATHCFKPEYIGVNAYLSMILGHSEYDLTTANSYQKYYI
jgi:hypothetical protein